MNDHDHWTSQLELYLDGLLTGEALQAFKRRLNHNEQLQTALKQQRRINVALRHRLAPPALPLLLEQFNRVALNGHADGHADVPSTLRMPSADTATAPTKTKRSHVRRYAIAAALLVAVIGGVLGRMVLLTGSTQPDEPPQFAKEPPRMSVDTYYQRKVVDDFEPAWVCKDDAEFKSWFSERFDQALLIGELPEHISMTGLDYNNCLSARTLSVLMKVNGQGVVVLVDKLDPGKCAPKVATGLHVFRRDLGKLVLFEITPLDQPQTLEHFYDPDAANEPPADSPSSPAPPDEADGDAPSSQPPGSAS